MNTVFDVALIVLGIVAVVIVLDAALRTFVLPRGAPVLFTHIIFRSVRSVLELIARPTRSFEFRDALPKNAYGKIMKRELREEYWRGHDRRLGGGRVIQAGTSSRL